MECPDSSQQFYPRCHHIPTLSQSSIDEKLKGCLGALDGTFIDVHVPISEKGRYRNRKGQVSVNVLGVCDMNMRFVYVLTGWEGSAADSRVLRNAINRENGLKVPRGIWSCDIGEWIVLATLRDKIETGLSLFMGIVHGLRSKKMP
ncbi:hypothetical protein ACS0TY_026335 [Phlomoides rotata]